MATKIWENHHIFLILVYFASRDLMTSLLLIISHINFASVYCQLGPPLMSFHLFEMSFIKCSYASEELKHLWIPSTLYVLQVHFEGDNWQKLCWEYCRVPGFLCKLLTAIILIRFFCYVYHYAIYVHHSSFAIIKMN